MKKYQKPETDILYVSVAQMIAVSPITERGGNLEDASETYATEGNLSRRRRRRNEWDDEEEEDEYAF